MRLAEWLIAIEGFGRMNTAKTVLHKPQNNPNSHDRPSLYSWPTSGLTTPYNSTTTFLSDILLAGQMLLQNGRLKTCSPGGCRVNTHNFANLLSILYQYLRRPQ